jgi:hypothetical protein
MNSNELFEFRKTPHTPTELLEHPSFGHLRLQPAWYPDKGQLDSITVYFRCSDSPSGVLAAGGFDLTPENKQMLAERKMRANDGPSRGSIAIARGCGTVGFGTSLLTGKTVELHDPKGLLK